MNSDKENLIIFSIIGLIVFGDMFGGQVFKWFWIILWIVIFIGLIIFHSTNKERS